MFIKGAEGRIWFFREGRGNHILVGQTRSAIEQDKAVSILNSYASDKLYELLSNEDVVKRCKERYEEESKVRSNG